MKAHVEPHSFRRYSEDVPRHCGYREDGEVCGRGEEHPVHAEWDGRCTGCGVPVENAGALRVCGGCQE